MTPAVAVLLLAAAAAPQAPGTIVVSARGAAQPVVVDLAKAALEERVVTDAQTGVKGAWRGVPLAALVKAAGGAPSNDAVLVRFKNGMAIQVALEDVAALDAFVAIAVKPDGAATFTGELPPIVRDKPLYRSPRTTKFPGAKIVLATLPKQPSTTVSPWAYADVPVAIELVSRTAWRAQFPVGDDAASQAGLAVFERRCAHCHGVRGVGASYGWDFVKPLPLHTWRDPANLAIHVRHHRLDAAEIGAEMPNQKDATDAEIAQVWAFMQAMAAKPLQPYVVAP